MKGLSRHRGAIRPRVLRALARRVHHRPDPWEVPTWRGIVLMLAMLAFYPVLAALIGGREVFVVSVVVFGGMAALFGGCAAAERARIAVDETDLRLAARASRDRLAARVIELYGERVTAAATADIFRLYVEGEERMKTDPAAARETFSRGLRIAARLEQPVRETREDGKGLRARIPAAWTGWLKPRIFGDHAKARRNIREV